LITGADKSVDWVDVCCVGYLFNGEYKLLFEDRSPIEKIYMDKNMLGETFLLGS